MLTILRVHRHAWCCAKGMRHVSGCAEPWAWVLQVPLQAVDLSHVSILYTQGDMAAITPIYDYNFQASRCKPEMLFRA